MLKSNKWLNQRVTSRSATDDNDSEETICGLCVDEPDQHHMAMEVCGHLFCIECLQYVPLDRTSHPVHCWNEMCLPRSELSMFTINDLHVAFDTSKLSDIKIIAQSAFIDARADMHECPRGGCDMIVKAPTMHISKTELLSSGGHVVHCGSCLTSYCQQCCHDKNTHSAVHPGRTCKEAQAWDQGVGSMHHKAITELLFLRCPNESCKAKFFEFDGCGALPCATCSQNFCALCFKVSPDAHACATPCNAKIFNNESYYVRMDDWHGLIRQLKKVEIEAYLQTIEDLELRQQTFKAIQPDLKLYHGGTIECVCP